MIQIRISLMFFVVILKMTRTYHRSNLIILWIRTFVVLVTLIISVVKKNSLGWGRMLPPWRLLPLPLPIPNRCFSLSRKPSSCFEDLAITPNGCIKRQQGKSEGFESCDWPIVRKRPLLGQNRWYFVPCDLEIWWMTLENNRASLLCYFKLCATFHSHWWIQTGVTVRKRPIWVKFDNF